MRTRRESTPMSDSPSKTSTGRFFEDFRLGETIVHATPRTVTAGDVSLYTALYGPRFAVQSSDAFAKAIGYAAAPVDDLLVFHIVFGKTVPDISLNAVANLGYADGRFLKPVFPGDTLSTTSEVIGLKQTSGGDAGIVYVRSIGRNQHNEIVLSYARWVLVRKRRPGSPAEFEQVPELPKSVAPEALVGASPSRVATSAVISARVASPTAAPRTTPSASTARMVGNDWPPSARNAVASASSARVGYAQSSRRSHDAGG